MTFTETVSSAWVVTPIVLVVIFVLPMLAKTNDGSAGIYEAGMLAVYLVALAWGTLMIVEGHETRGWIVVIAAAGLFGSRLYFILYRIERKMRGPSDSETGRR
jgi:hypothetical protein